MKTYSHNTFTYLPAKGIVSKLLRPFAKCQEVDYTRQIFACNAEAIDIRVWLDKHGYLQLRHGAMRMKTPCNEYNFVDRVLTLLSEKAPATRVRVTLEDGGLRRFIRPAVVAKDFAEYCKYLQDTFPNLTFFGGRRKSDWAVVFAGFNGGSDAWAEHGTDAHSHGLAIPKRYARKHNAETREQYQSDDTTPVWQDFVNL